MSLERVASIIALALTVFQLDITYAQLYEQVYRFKARCFKNERDLWNDYAQQKTWLLNNAGAKSIQITAVGAVSLNLKIAASSRGQQRIKTFFTTRDCKNGSSIKYLASLFQKESDSAEVNAPIISRIGPDSKGEKLSV